jgi:hypothetical protein
MEQPQTSKFPKLESNLDQLIQELHQLASRVRQSDPYQPRDDSTSGPGQYLIATGR